MIHTECIWRRNGIEMREFVVEGRALEEPYR